MNYTELMGDGQLIGGAYELSKLLQFGCEHYDLDPTPENMAWVHSNITYSAPLGRAAALEYAADLIADAAGEITGHEPNGGEMAAIEAALVAREAER